MSGAAVATTQACCNQCGATLTGPYCQNCGQPSVAVRRSFGDAIYGQTGRLLHSLWLVVSKPGEIAREIDEARDRRSIRPGALLTNIIAVFFVVAGGLGGFDAREIIRSDPTGRVAAIASERSAARGVSTAVYYERLDNRFRSTYSVLITSSALAYALAFRLLHRRRPKSWLVHLAAGIQYLCATFLLSAVAFATARLEGGAMNEHPLLGFGTLALLGVYLVLLQRRVYGDSTGMAALKMLAVLAIGGMWDAFIAYLSLGVSLLTA
jgi:hypothetical protein